MRGALADRHHPRPSGTPPGPDHQARPRSTRTPPRSPACPGHPTRTRPWLISRHRQERPPGQLISDRHRHLREQLPQWLISQPLAGLGDPARRRHLPRLIPAAPRRERPGQPGSGLLIVIISEQRQRHHQVDHHMRRELPVPPPRLPPRDLDRLIDRITRHRRRQHPQRHPVRQPATRHHAIVCHKPRSCRPPARTPHSDTPRTKDQLRLSGIGS